MDPLQFQELRRDVWQEEPEFDEVEVYGTPGQTQLGIDLLAIGKDGKARAAGQCKRVHPDSVNEKLIKDTVTEFLEYKEHWSTSGVRNRKLTNWSWPCCRQGKTASRGWVAWMLDGALPPGADGLERSLYPFCPRPGFQKRLGQLSQRTTAEFSTQAQFFAEFFAELRAIGTPNPPVYSSVRR